MFPKCAFWSTTLQPLYEQHPTRREDLLKFFTESASDNDLRPMLLCPKFEDPPEFVIQLDENHFALYKL